MTLAITLTDNFIADFLFYILKYMIKDSESIDIDLTVPTKVWIHEVRKLLLLIPCSHLVTGAEESSKAAAQKPN